MDVVRFGKFVEFSLRFIEFELRDFCNDDVLRDNSVVISLILRVWGNDGWNKYGLCNIYIGYFKIIF